MTKYIDKNHQQDPSKCIVSVIILRDTISAYIETFYSLFVVFLQSVNISVLIHITQYTYTIISILMLNIRRLIQQILNFTLEKEIYRLCGSICLLSDMSSKGGKNNIAQKCLKTGELVSFSNQCLCWDNSSSPFFKLSDFLGAEVSLEFYKAKWIIRFWFWGNFAFKGAFPFNLIPRKSSSVYQMNKMCSKERAEGQTDIDRRKRIQPAGSYFI